jgi:predicted dehydrogenase
MTDWGAHHLDIAQWAIGAQFSGPVEIDSEANLPDTPNGYNVPLDFQATMTYANGVVMEIFDTGASGITFEGDDGSIFVDRGKISGDAVDALEKDPLDKADYKMYAHDLPDRELRTGKLASLVNHMANFFDCVRTRETPISDVVSQHRSATVCHLGNLSMLLGRKLKWDPDAEQFVGDAEANALLSREQRKGYEIKA